MQRFGQNDTTYINTTAGAMTLLSSCITLFLIGGGFADLLGGK